MQKERTQDLLYSLPLFLSLSLNPLWVDLTQVLVLSNISWQTNFNKCWKNY